MRRPPDAAGAHARWIEFPAGPVDAGLAANSRHPGQEYYDAEDGIGQREERNYSDEYSAGGVMQCKRALWPNAVDRQAEIQDSKDRHRGP